MDKPQEIEQLKVVAGIAGLAPDAFALPEDREVIANRMRFHYLDWGGGALRDILFLHGGGLNAHTWDLVCLMLRNRYHCVALDQRGHGDSEWSPACDYRIPTQVGDIEAFVEKTRLRNPLLVGQSMGGLNSLGYAIRHSASMPGMVVVDVGPEINPEGTRRIVEFSATPELDSPEEFLQRAVKFNPLRDPAVLKRSLHYNLRQLPSGKWSLKHDQRRASVTRGGEDDRLAAVRELGREVPKITCPAMIVRGALSDVLSDEAAERFARSLPKGQWTRVEKAGHNLQGDNPRGLLEVLVRFFDQIGF